MEEKLEQSILIYDAKCPLCVRFKESLERIPDAKSIQFISVYDDSLYERFEFLDKDMCLQDVHMITQERKVLVGTEVLEHLIVLYPAVKKFSWLIETNMGQKAVNYFHHMTNRYRKLVKSRCPSCLR